MSSLRRVSEGRAGAEQSEAPGKAAGGLTRRDRSADCAGHAYRTAIDSVYERKEQ